MLAEIIIGVIGVSQARKQLKTAKINRQIQLFQTAKQYLETTGGDKATSEFLTEYSKVKQQLKEGSIWQ